MKEVIQLRVWQKMLVVPSQLGLKFGATTNIMGRLLKGNVKESGQKTLINMSENRKCTTKEAGVNVCERNVRNQLKEMGFPSREGKHKPSVTPKEKKSRFQWAEEKQSWTVDGWMEVRFRDESPRRRCWNFSLVQ